MASRDDQTSGRLQAILDAALDCIVCMDVHGSIQEFNAAAEKTFGYPREAVLGKELAAVLIPPELREQHRRGMARYFDTGESRVLGKRIEIPALRADGSRILVELAITEIRFEEGPFFTAYLRDITATRRTEQRRAVQYAVAESLSGARKIGEIGPSILATVAALAGWEYGAVWLRRKKSDVLESVTNWRAEARQLPNFDSVSATLSFRPGEGLPGRVVQSRRAAWIRDVVQDPSFRRRSAALADGLHAAFAFPLLAGANVVGVIEFFSSMVHDPDDDLLSFSAALGSSIGQFIERQFAEEEIEEQRRAAEAANAAKDRFIAMLSHELRTPLTPVLMWASAAEADETLPAELREDVGMVRRNIALEARLIDDLLHVSRIRHGKMRLRRKVCALRDVLRRALELVRAEIEAKNFQLEIRNEVAMPDIFCDPDRLQQVFANLLQNACKFTPVQGKITIRTDTEPSIARIDIIDSGVGIPPEMLGRLFQPFEQAEQKTSGGLGLGLAIARGFVDLHGGTIQAASAGVGQGATFTVRLPIDESDAAKALAFAQR